MIKLKKEKIILIEEPIRKDLIRPWSPILCHLCVKIMKRKCHQLHEKIRDEGNIYSGIDMEHNPTTDKTDSKLGYKQQQLSNEDQRNKT